MPKVFIEDVREEFIISLMKFSKGNISYQEANSIADKKLKCEDFYGDSPLGHKGPRWVALSIARNMGYTKYPSC